jgi:hypothetical protein
MFSRENPMRARLASGRVFVRFVVIEDQAQRRSICGALNQWLISSTDTASGIGAHFATSLELTPAADDLSVPRPPSTVAADVIPRFLQAEPPDSMPNALDRVPAPDSGAAKNLHCPCPLPSGF